VFTEHCTSVEKVVELQVENDEVNNETEKQVNLNTLKTTCEELFLVFN
jgi:hypothetical protein